MDVKAALFSLATVVTAFPGSWKPEERPEPGWPHIIHPLRQMRGSSGKSANGLSSSSWRLAVETYNLRDWETVPGQCADYVGNYMLGDHYRKDFAMVTAEAA